MGIGARRHTKVDLLSASLQVQNQTWVRAVTGTCGGYSRGVFGNKGFSLGRLSDPTGNVFVVSLLCPCEKANFSIPWWSEIRGYVRAMFQANLLAIGPVNHWINSLLTFGHTSRR